MRSLPLRPPGRPTMKSENSFKSLLLLVKTVRGTFVLRRYESHRSTTRPEGAV